MEGLFVKILFGHLAGDYLFQSKAMAMNKTNKGFGGWLWCLFHCSVYVACVCVTLWRFEPSVIAIVFLTHFPIDRWSLASLWLKLIRGRSFEQAFTSTDQFREFDIVFTSIVYTVVDNTMHLMLMWFLLPLVL